jgi:(p)ppGpp synthase/HD superfamily hydrolase
MRETLSNNKDKFPLSLRAFDFVKDLEAGKFRRDKVTPNFHHMLSVARLCWTLSDSLIDPDKTIATAFLHDVIEDHESFSLGDLAIDYGVDVALSVACLSRNNFKGSQSYYETIAIDPSASIVKLADRAHNLRSMVSVFNFDKQKRYLEEAKTYYPQMISTARKSFPQQIHAYENLKIILHVTWDLIEEILDQKAEIDGYRFDLYGPSLIF